jgi:hypothetical protein
MVIMKKGTRQPGKVTRCYKRWSGVYHGCQGRFIHQLAQVIQTTTRMVKQVLIMVMTVLSAKVLLAAEGKVVLLRGAMWCCWIGTPRSS